MSRCVALTVLLAAMAATSPARGQQAEVDALTKEGLQLRRQGLDAQALDAFKRAYAIGPSARGLAQIALAEQALGQWIAAERDLERALAEAVDPWIARNREALERGLAAIREHLGRLEVVIDVAGAEVWINGALAGTAPLRELLRVEAGTVVVEVRAPGYAPVRRITSVEPGGTAREPITLVPIVAAPPEHAPVSPPPRLDAAPPPRAQVTRSSFGDDRWRAVGWVPLGAGVLGVAFGAYFAARTIAAKSDRDAECGARGCTPRGVAFDREARSLAERSTAWTVAGALSAAIGGVILLMPGTRPRHAAVLRAAPDLGLDRAGVTFDAAW